MGSVSLNLPLVGSLIVATFADLPASASDGQIAVTADSGDIYTFDTTSSTWQPKGVTAGSGIVSINGQTGNGQTLAVGTAGTDFGVSSAANTHTFNLPDASATARGVVTTGTQSIAGSKSFLNPIIAPDGTLSAPGVRFTTDNDTGFFQTGDGNLSVAANGTLKASFDQNTIDFYSVSQVTVNSDLDVTGALDVTGNISAANYPPTGSANKVAQFSGVGVLTSSTAYTFNADNGLDSQAQIDFDNGTGGQAFQTQNLAFGSLQNSPNEQWNINNFNIQIDPDSDGFDMGTSGGFLAMFNLGFSHQGTSNIGALNYFSMNNDLGNGTDPISINGLSYFSAFGNIDANVTMTNSIQPFVTGINMVAGSVMNNSITTYADYNNIQTAVPNYTCASFGPNVLEIKNNTNFTGINFNPTVTTFTGNAGFNGIGISGNYGTFGTGAWQGVLINPTVTSVVNATGLFIDMTNVTASGSKKAGYFGGDVQITGSLTFGGALSIGQLSAYYATNTVNGGGNPTTLHGLVTSVTAPASSTIANADMIGTNTAMLINLAAGSTTTSGPLELGLAALALPCVVETHTGATLDFMNCAGYALSLSGTSTGGTIDTVNLCRTTAIPNGITTINNLKAFKFDLLFGGVATNTWGVYIAPDVNNYMQGNLLIGGTSGSVDTVTNSSVGLEIISTTKAFLNARMTTTERNALTAVNGMQIYNTTDDKLQVYAAGSWVDLH